LIDLLIDELIE